MKNDRKTWPFLFLMAMYGVKNRKDFWLKSVLVIVFTLGLFFYSKIICPDPGLSSKIMNLVFLLVGLIVTNLIAFVWGVKNGYFD